MHMHMHDHEDELPATVVGLIVRLFTLYGSSKHSSRIS